ncbi:MAG: hypothetical protein IJH87_03900, partial [Atopobiaceae bacterium]|nr:hypothetical protein [Atopobiaceae bacterium]
MFQPFLFMGIPILLFTVIAVFLMVRRITMGVSRGTVQGAGILILGFMLIIFIASAAFVFISVRRFIMNDPQENLGGVPILEFCDDDGTRQLVSDMESGRIPLSCNVLFDQGGGLPDVTITDPETITEIYELLSGVSVGLESPMSITDSYHHVIFTLQDGTTVGWGFEGT